MQIFYKGLGGTNGDAWIVFRELRVAHAGDIFSGKNIPGLDAVNGGSGLAIADTLTKAADTIPNAVTTGLGVSAAVARASQNVWT